MKILNNIIEWVIRNKKSVNVVALPPDYWKYGNSIRKSVSKKALRKIKKVQGVSEGTIKLSYKAEYNPEYHAICYDVQPSNPDSLFILFKITAFEPSTNSITLTFDGTVK